MTLCSYCLTGLGANLFGQSNLGLDGKMHLVKVHGSMNTKLNCDFTNSELKSAATLRTLNFYSKMVLQLQLCLSQFCSCPRICACITCNTTNSTYSVYISCQHLLSSSHWFGYEGDYRLLLSSFQIWVISRRSAHSMRDSLKGWLLKRIGLASSDGTQDWDLAVDGTILLVHGANSFEHDVEDLIHN